MVNLNWCFTQLFPIAKYHVDLTIVVWNVPCYLGGTHTFSFFKIDFLCQVSWHMSLISAFRWQVSESEVIMMDLVHFGIARDKDWEHVYNGCLLCNFIIKWRLLMNFVGSWNFFCSSLKLISNSFYINESSYTWVQHIFSCMIKCIFSCMSTVFLLMYKYREYLSCMSTVFLLMYEYSVSFHV